MSPPLRRYLFPALCGTAIVFAIRLIFADLSVALIGIVVFAVVLAVVALLARTLRWQEAPVLHAMVAAVAVTIAFLVTEPRA